MAGGAAALRAPRAAQVPLATAEPASVRGLLIGVALGLWAAGDIVWTIAYQDLDSPPFPSVADYLWLAVRTDPDAPKHQGISILIVDTSDPGYSWTPIITADGSPSTLRRTSTPGRRPRSRHRGGRPSGRPSIGQHEVPPAHFGSRDRGQRL